MLRAPRRPSSRQDRGRGIAVLSPASPIVRAAAGSLFAIWSSGRLGIVQLSGRAGAVIRDRGCNSPIVQSRGTRHGQAAQNPAQQAQTANRVLSGATNSPQPLPPSWPALLLITSPSPPASFLPKPLSGLFLPAEGKGKTKLPREGRSPRRKEPPAGSSGSSLHCLFLFSLSRLIYSPACPRLHSILNLSTVSPVLLCRRPVQRPV